MQRVVRVAIVSLVLLGTLVWSLATLLAPKNIALHKPVSVSSTHPGSSPNPPGAHRWCHLGVVCGAHRQRR